jgi:hypothetical protein
VDIFSEGARRRAGVLTPKHLAPIEASILAEILRIAGIAPKTKEDRVISPALKAKR